MRTLYRFRLHFINRSALKERRLFGRGFDIRETTEKITHKKCVHDLKRINYEIIIKCT